jgi:hypothetical protein
VDFADVKFVDWLDDDLQFVNGSFKVDGKQETPKITGQEISFVIDKLPKHGEIIITFKVKVKC